jgi:hypothetical protein
MATLALRLEEYNDLRVQAALTTWRERNGNPRAPLGGGPARVPLSPYGPPQGVASATRMNTGDSTWVSVTPGRSGARRGGRPRVHENPAAGNRARQRTYRARRRATVSGASR